MFSVRWKKEKKRKNIDRDFIYKSNKRKTEKWAALSLLIIVMSVHGLSSHCSLFWVLFHASLNLLNFGELACPSLEWAWSSSGPVKHILTGFDPALSVLITWMFVRLVSLWCSQVVPLLHFRTAAEPTGPSTSGGRGCCGRWQSSCHLAKTI